MDEDSPRKVTIRPEQRHAGNIGNAHIHQGERDRGAGEGQHIKGELAHLQASSPLSSTAAWRLAQTCGKQFARDLGMALGPARLLRAPGRGGLRQFARHDPDRTSSRRASPASCSAWKDRDLRSACRRSSRRHASIAVRFHTPAVPLNEIGSPARKRASCSTAKWESSNRPCTRVSQLALRLAWPQRACTKAKPVSASKRRHGAAQEIRRRHEVGIEDRHIRRIAMFEAEGEIAGLEAGAIAAMQNLPASRLPASPPWRRAPARHGRRCRHHPEAGW